MSCNTTLIARRLQRLMANIYGQILIIEDESDIRCLIEATLQKAGYLTIATDEGAAGLEMIRSQAPDLVILDVGLPGLDGLSICREARKFYDAPILFLSAREEAFDKILGLEVGADDYLTKPFHPGELVARVRALQRRSQSNTRPAVDAGRDQEFVRFAAFVIDTAGHAVAYDSQPVHLTRIEFSLLLLLVQRAGRVQTRQALLDELWGDDYVGDERTVDVHIRHLRQKLRAYDPTEYIYAVRGIGYKFDPGGG